ncbi:MAG TPA: hypothetical protein DHW34_00500 [Actinobacteria bacterium]|nr:hypothetical protein [Actinomycetota bacterium]HCK78478.1 hypothetical protein [Actinomycetota bacterium]
MPDAPAAGGPPAPGPIDRTGREVVRSVLARVIAETGVTEVLAEDGSPALPLTGAGGPLEGVSIGAFHEYTRDDGLRLVYSELSVDAFGMDTHQLYAFTPAGSAVPHLFVDSAISPNTDGTFHFGLDLAPRVDLGSHLDYSEAVYGPLTTPRSEALSQPGVEPVPSLGPLQWSIRSPWMVAAITDPAALRSLTGITDLYVTQWLALLANGLGSEVENTITDEPVELRDRRNREAMFSPRTNPVWGLLDKLVGAEAAQAMKDLLVGN